jgi:hypothetical protein
VAHGVCAPEAHRRPPGHEARGAARPEPDGWRDAGPGHTAPHGGRAGHGAGACQLLSTGASRRDPRRRGWPARRSPLAASPGPHARPDGTPGVWGGRDPRAPPWGEAPGPRPGPRSRAVLAQPSGPGPRRARGEPQAGGPECVGDAALGRAVLAGPRARRARPWGAGATAPDAHRRGVAAGPGGAPLGARARAGGGTASRVAGRTRWWRVRPRPHPRCGITRWRWDAARYAPAPPRPPRHTGRPRRPGQRRPPWAHGVAQTATRWPTATGRGW